MLAAERQRFLEDYSRIRQAEGRGSDDPAYYLALPYRDLSGRLDWGYDGWLAYFKMDFGGGVSSR